MTASRRFAGSSLGCRNAKNRWRARQVCDAGSGPSRRCKKEEMEKTFWLLNLTTPRWRPTSFTSRKVRGRINETRNSGSLLTQEFLAPQQRADMFSVAKNLGCSALSRRARRRHFLNQQSGSRMQSSLNRGVCFSHPLIRQHLYSHLWRVKHFRLPLRSTWLYDGWQGNSDVVNRG
jgi:hypothetical protein